MWTYPGALGILKVSFFTEIAMRMPYPVPYTE
jgi:hypothetical protein